MILIKNGFIKTMAGEDIKNGDVLIGDDGKILQVGKGLKLEGAEVIDADGKLVTPGCIDAHCHIGLDNTAMRWEGRDYNEDTDPVTPQLRAIDSIYPQDEAFADAISHGVTAVCTGPGSANVIGGTFTAIKTVGNRVDNMIIKDPVAMKCAFGENPKQVFGQIQKKSPITRMAVVAILRETLFKAQRYLADKEAGKEPAFDMKLEAMIPVIKKEIPLKAHAHRSDDILSAIRVAKEFDLKLTLDHCTDGEIICSELVKEGYPAFIGPSFGSKSKIELKNKSFTTAGTLNKAGVPICIITDAPVIPIQHLAMCAGFAVEGGLSEEEAWKAITINPAIHLGISERVGSLEAGKDADVVIWSDNPIKRLGASAFLTIVDGKIVYQIK